MAYSMAVKLTPEQIEVRRRQLNATGLQAWLSPLVVLLIIYICRKWLFPTISPKLKGHTGSSTTSDRQNQIQLFLHRVIGLMNTTYVREFGPLKIQLLAAGYTIYLIYLTARHTGDDYMHLTKAFGHVAVAQLPMHYLLAVKSREWNLVYHATGLTHDKLNPIHRLFGRIIHLWMGIHTVLYLRFFVYLGILPTALRRWNVRYGLLAFLSVSVLAILALPAVRRRAYYKVFYRSHVLFSALLGVLLWLHVPYTRWIIGQVGVIYLGNVLLRVGSRKTRNVRRTMRDPGLSRDRDRW